MITRHWNDSRVRLVDCPGSDRTPITRVKDVGVCPGCGVRTFLRGRMIQPHQATRTEIAAESESRRQALRARRLA